MLFTTCFCSAQEQVSDIYFDDLKYPVAVGDNCGFHTYDGVEYMIVDNDSLQIFELVEEEFVLRHVVHKPRDFAFKIIGHISNNSSQKSIEGKFYYSFFRSGIMIVDIEDGSIYREKDLSELNYELNRVLKKTDNQIYFYGFYGDSGRGFYRYDIDTDEILLLEGFLNSITNMNLIGHIYYFNDESLSSIRGYDMLNDSFFVKFQYNGELISKLRWRSNMGEDYVVFRDNDGFKFIRKNGDLVKFLCNNDLPEKTTLAIRANKYIAASKKDLEDFVQIYNVNDCELIHEFKIQDDDYSFTNTFYINDNQIEDYTIIGYYGHYFGYGLGIVIDHKSNTESYIFSYDFVFPDAAVETNNAIYWIGYDEIELSPSLYYVLRYDKASKEVSSISPYDNKVYSSSLGISQQDEIYFAANNYDNDYNIWKTSDGESFTVAKQLDFKQNLGVYSRSNIRIDEESIVSDGSGGLMITDDDTQLLSESPAWRDLAITEDYIATVITESDSNFVLKYNKHSGIATKIFLNTVPSYLFSPVINDKYVFKIDHTTSQYFDIEKEELKNLDDKSSTLDIDPHRYYPSRDKMMVTEETSFYEPQNYYYFDFETQVLEKIDHQLTKSFQWLVTNDNTFYIDNTEFNSNYEQITRIRDGETPFIIYEGYCYEINMSSSPTIQYGEYAKLLIKCDNEILVISDDGISPVTTKINHDTYFHSSDILYSNKDEYFIKSTDDGNISYKLFNAPSSLVHVSISPEEELLTTSFDLEKPLLITVNEELKILKFYLLNRQTGGMTLEFVHPYSTKDYPRFQFSPQAISASKYLVTAQGENKGYELFEIDLVDESFDLKVDFYEGKLSSTPYHYTRTSDYLYFIAQLEKEGRQWFRVKTNVTSDDHDIEIESLQILNLYPNPATSTVSFDKNLNSYTIYNVQGQKVFEKSENNSKSISIDQFPIGEYFISGLGDQGLLYSGKFLKMK